MAIGKTMVLLGLSHPVKGRKKARMAVMRIIMHEIGPSDAWIAAQIVGHRMTWPGIFQRPLAYGSALRICLGPFGASVWSISCAVVTEELRPGEMIEFPTGVCFLAGAVGVIQRRATPVNARAALLHCRCAEVPQYPTGSGTV